MQVVSIKLKLMIYRLTISYNLSYNITVRGDAIMKIDISQIVSISEANQNFSKVACMVDKNGEVIIFKNNKPKYRLVDIENSTEIEMTDDEKIDFVAARILKKYRRAFEELAK